MLKRNIVTWIKYLVACAVLSLLFYVIRLEGKIGIDQYLTADSLSPPPTRGTAVVNNPQTANTPKPLPKLAAVMPSEPPAAVSPSLRQLEKEKVKVIYRNLSRCPKPEYKEEYKAHCWHKGNQVQCVPNLYLLGVRKCGSWDIRAWFADHNSVHMKGGDLSRLSKTRCPTDLLKDTVSAKQNYFLYGPGNLLVSAIDHQNATHIQVTSAMQMIGYASTPQTKFLIQLRNPTDRFKLILRKMSFERLDAAFVNQTMTGLMEDLAKCTERYGELACIYQTSGKPGEMAALIKHSLYIVYIEEAFKFIPREQFIITSFNHEYVVSETDTIKRIMNFFDVPFQTPTANLSETVANQGKKNTVWNSTIKTLDTFFEPYNKRLATLLNDERFLFKR